MKRKWICALLAVAMLLSMIPGAALRTSAANYEYTSSDAFIEVLKTMEGFYKRATWDYKQYTVGYGTRCPDDMLTYYRENGITEEEAEVLLRNHLNAIELDINKRVIGGYGITLNQSQFDALVSFSYNCGTGWISDKNGTLPKALKNGATGSELVRAFAVWCNAGGQIKDFLGLTYESGVKPIEVS